MLKENMMMLRCNAKRKEEIEGMLKGESILQVIL